MAEKGTDNRIIFHGKRTCSKTIMEDEQCFHKCAEHGIDWGVSAECYTSKIITEDE